jgi:hypothetical protein
MYENDMPMGNLFCSIENESLIDHKKMIKALNKYAWSDHTELMWEHDPGSNQIFLAGICGAPYPTLFPREVVQYEIKVTNENVTTKLPSEMLDSDYDLIVDRQIDDDNFVPFNRLVNEISACISAGSINLFCVSTHLEIEASSIHISIDSKNNGARVHSWCSDEDGFNQSIDKVLSGMLAS